MQYLRISLCAVLGLSLASGCSSSSTTGSGNSGSSSAHSQKSADDEANELMVKAMTMTDAEKREKGEAMGKRIMELRDLVSAETRKRIDALTVMHIDSAIDSRAPAHADNSTAESATAKSKVVRPVLPPDQTAPKLSEAEKAPQPAK